MDAASANGLAGKGLYPLLGLTGSVDGVAVSLDQQRELVEDARGQPEVDADGAQEHHTVCEASAVPLHGIGDLEVAEAGLFAKLGKLVGVAGIKTGDDAFDRRFTVKASDREAAIRVLAPAARAALTDVEKRIRHVSVHAGAVRYHGHRVDFAHALEIVRGLAKVASSLGA